MNNVKQDYTLEQIEQRAKENSEMYWAAREREEQVKMEQNRIKRITEIHRPFRQR